MPISSLVILIILFFFTSVVGVVTGSNSLVTVPVMFQFGIDEKVAVATNMFGLTFMAIGGTIPFVRQGSVEFRKVTPLIVLTVISSALGAALVGYITNQGIKLIVSVAMIAVAVFTILRPKGSEPPASAGGGKSDLKATSFDFTDADMSLGAAPPADAGGSDKTSKPTLKAGTAFILVFLLGIYGGLYSGGYVTILTAVLVAFFGLTFTESIASTKLINVFSSLVATIVFMWQGLVDYKLGIILAVTMFAGAYAGAHFASKMNDVWLRRIFLSAVFILAIKTFYDLIF